MDYNEYAITLLGLGVLVSAIPSADAWHGFDPWDGDRDDF